MNKSVYVFSGIVLCLIFSLTAVADDLVIPPWRGLPGTTFEKWTFDNPPVGATPPYNQGPYILDPDEMINTFGGATATVTIGAEGAGWIDQNTFLYGDRQGLWDIGASEEGSIVLDIFNDPTLNPFKLIQIQITYLAGLYMAPVVELTDPTATGPIDPVETIYLEDIAMGLQWRLDRYEIMIEPNPDFEQIIFTSDMTPQGGYAGAIIDQIVVDTYCYVPEPGSMCLLMVGGVAFLIKRFRK